VSRPLPLVGFGAGGHAKVIVELLRTLGTHEVIGLLDPDHRLWNTRVVGVPVLGGDELMARLRTDGVEAAFIGVGSSGDMGPRQRVYLEALAHGFRIVSAVHPTAWVSASAHLGDGATVLGHAVVNTDAVLGENVLINTGAIVEHDCILGSHVHVASGAILAGRVTVGGGSHVGAGATVRDGCRIGSGVIVGAGAVVVRDVPDRVVVVGSPARVMRTRASVD
jgi:UDP-perosamine 4-acetyltransferase